VGSDWSARIDAGAPTRSAKADRGIDDVAEVSRAGPEVWDSGKTPNPSIDFIAFLCSLPDEVSSEKDARF